MKSILQSWLLRVYQIVQRSGLLSTRPGSAVFQWAYHMYKRFLEAGDIRVLGNLIRPGTVVIDVGANIGFFTKFFGRCVSEGGKVIAIEPEAANFDRLHGMLLRERFKDVVEPIQAVAADGNGFLKLRVNPLHPADHKIAEDGVCVRSVSLDQLLAERHWPWVSLIKIDVQGAEGMVLDGAKETIQRFHPALFLEIDDANLRAMKTKAESIFQFLGKYGYLAHRVVNGRLSRPLDVQECIPLCVEGRYADFVFLSPKKTQSHGRKSIGTVKHAKVAALQTA